MQAIVVALDRLATSVLGCYGNDWIETPHLDRLASKSVVFDRHFAEHTGESVGVSLGTGRLPHDAAAHADELKSDWSSVTDALGVELHLLHEADALPWSSLMKATSRAVIAAQPDSDPKPDEIPFARLVRAACTTLTQPRGAASRIVWLHSAGVPEPWLPPEGFATLYFEDYAERGCDMSAVTRDNWGTHPAAYAGYVSLLDHWLGELLAVVKASAANEPTLLVFIAACGCDWTQEPGPRTFVSSFDEEDDSFPIEVAPFNEAAVDEAVSETEIEIAPERLHQPTLSRPTHSLVEEVTRTPLLLRLFDGGSFDVEFAGTRSQRLVQTADLAATLLDFFQLPMSPTVIDGRSLLNELIETDLPRDRVCFTDGAGSRGIRTVDWSCLVREPVESSDADSHEAGPPGAEPSAQLFAKPEDYWEVNDVSGQQREVTATLIGQLNAALPMLPRSLLP